MADTPLNEPAEIPPELDRWNWGAFLLHWIWGLGNSVFIALLMFVPFVNIVMMFVLGAKGSKWAWRNRAWRSPEHFRKTQRSWAIAGFAVWGLTLLVIAATVSSIPRMMKSADAYPMTLRAVQADPNVRAALGDDIDDGYWVWGNVNVNSDGTGAARLSFPVEGSKGKGTVLSDAVRDNGQWTLRLVVVSVDGSDVPIVVINEGNAQVPGAAIGI